MLYKKYGNTGKELSVIGFGGMRFTKDGENYDIDKCAEIVRKANELGVNYFDTAPGYCDDFSEIIMGRAFEAMPNDFYVSTKSSKKDGSALRKQLETSLSRLKVNKIDFFHIWCILDLEDYKSRMVKGGAFEAALKAKEEGLIEHIVFSTHCNGDEIETIVKNGGFEGMTVGYNFLNFPYRQKGLKVAHEHGLGIATMNPLSGGVIPEKADELSFIMAEDDKNVVQSALRFNASHEEITTVLAGMSSIEQVLENVEVGSNTKPYSKEHIETVKAKLSASMDTLCTGCRYCEYCPKEIPVSKFMQSYNNKIMGSPNDAQGFIKWHFHVDHKQIKECIECGVCEKKCTQHLPIISRLKEIDGWFE